MSERALAMAAINETPIFEIAQREPYCNTTDAEPAAKLVLTGDGERRRIIPAENLLRNRRD
jgi:hypothetical protein